MSVAKISIAHNYHGQSRDSTVSTVTGYGIKGWPTKGSEFDSQQGRFSLLHSVHTDSEAHTASYPMGTRGSFSGGGGTAAGA
jgi:hypothetical protein